MVGVDGACAAGVELGKGDIEWRRSGGVCAGVEYGFVLVFPPPGGPLRGNIFRMKTMRFLRSFYVS
jgi:hypothetical protein